MDIIRDPRVTLLARPQFLEPAHLPVQWKGESSDGERLAEFAGRLCYMSQHNPAGRSTADYLQNILKQGHGSVFEHSTYVLLIEGISRSCSHELVRHRAGLGYSQLSQRYVDESHAAFVMPPAIRATRRSRRRGPGRSSRRRRPTWTAVERLMERYGWVDEQGPPAEDGARGGAKRSAQRHRGEDRRQRQRPRLAHDAGASPGRGRRAGDPPDGGRPVSASSSGKLRRSSPTSSSIESGDGSEAGRVGFHKV